MAAASVPSVEPTSFHVGDTVTWKISVGDYSAADGWTLKYSLVNANGLISISSAASGSDHLVELSAATTAAYIPGEYSWTSCVEGGSSERYHIGSGTITLGVNYSAQTQYDARSWVKITLDAIRARLSGNASTMQLARRVGDLSVNEMSLAQLLESESTLAAKYADEKAADDLTNGRPRATKIKTAFVSY